MKVDKSSHHPKRKIFIIIISILTISSVVYFAYMKVSDHNKNQSTTNYSSPTDEQKATGSSIKQNTNNATAGKTNAINNNQPLDPVAQPDGKSIINISMTSPLDNTIYKQSDTIQLRFLIESKESSGTCKLTLSKDGSNSIEKVASLFQSGPTTSTCRGFDIPATSLSVGKWNVDLVFENDTIYGHTNGNILIN